MRPLASPGDDEKKEETTDFADFTDFLIIGVICVICGLFSWQFLMMRALPGDL
jgi:hypothetical protein